MSFQRLRRVSSVVLGLIFCFGMFAPSAAAVQLTPAADCNQQTLDRTAGHVLDGDTSIQDMVKQLDSQGVDTRVRVFDVPPGGSLEAYEAAQIQTCPSWGANGRIKPSLVVVLDSLDRHDAIFYGKNLADQMESEVDAIRGAMQTPNAQGHYAEAIHTALYDSSQVIKGDQDPATEVDGLPDWAWGLIIVGGLILVFGLVRLIMRSVGGGGGGGRGGSYHGGTYFSDYGGGGGSPSSGSDGGSAGSW